MGKRSKRAPAAVMDAVQDRLPGPVAEVVRWLRNEDVFLLSAALAFYALVSVVPFSILVLWVVSVFTGESRVKEVADRLADVLPANLGVEGAFQRVADLGARLGVGALLALLWPATAYGSGLRRAFDRLSRNRDEEAKGLRGRALAFGLLGVVPALALAALVASLLGTKVLGEGPLATVLGWLLALVFGFVAGTLGATALYRLFAPGHLSTKAMVRGAAAAAAAIAVVSVGYVAFLNVGADFERRYATSGLAAIVLLALWLYLANALILLGFRIAQES
ncbi:MAG TPA: YihY/virulence factor BrkB family protein [Acidimicrobiales bacterium]|nr:YihY/virulence factor BrkB family protein [Acidimicrobiales bacterium]